MKRLMILSVVCLGLIACTSSQILVTIQASLGAIAALQGALPTLGVSPALSTEIGTYAAAAASGIGQCSTLLAQGGETATILTKCSQDLAGAVKPNLPSGTPANVAGLIEAVAGEIQVVYAAIEAASPAPAAAAKTALSLPKTWTLSKKDAAKLKKLANQAMTLSQRR